MNTSILYCGLENFCEIGSFMVENQPKIYKLSDYRVPEYLIDHIDLEIDISKFPVQSKSLLTIKPNPKSETRSADLILDGENMTLTSILLNGKLLEPKQYTISSNSLTIKNVPQTKTFTLETSTLLGNNTDLFG
jgi:aminopeptidase N